jgi:hypothetical protein
MIRLGLNVVQLLVQYPTGGTAAPGTTGTTSSINPQLDFSISANSGYRGYYF